MALPDRRLPRLCHIDDATLIVLALTPGSSVVGMTAMGPSVGVTRMLGEVDGVPIPMILGFNALREQGRPRRAGRRDLLAGRRGELLPRRRRPDASISAIEGRIARCDRLAGAEL